MVLAVAVPEERILCKLAGMWKICPGDARGGWERRRIPAPPLFAARLVGWYLLAHDVISTCTCAAKVSVRACKAHPFDGR